jgi:hypothetical protein
MSDKVEVIENEELDPTNAETLEEAMKQRAAEMDDMRQMAINDVKDIVLTMQYLINVIVKSNSRYIKSKLHESVIGLYKDVLPAALEVSEGKIEGAKKIMFNDKVECLVLSFDDACEYAIIVPTMSGVTLADHMFMIVKKDIDKMGTITE